jgi:hypothetical protein
MSSLLSLRGGFLPCHCEEAPFFVIARRRNRRSNLPKAAQDEIAALHFVPLAMTILYAIVRRLPPLSLRGGSLFCHCEEAQPTKQSPKSRSGARMLCSNLTPLQWPYYSAASSTSKFLPHAFLMVIARLSRAL